MTKELNVYILLDRSGSMKHDDGMGTRWKQSIEGINSYLDKLRAEPEVNAYISLAAFDYGPSGIFFKWMRGAAGGVALSQCQKIQPNETFPEGGTPLYDSIIDMINIARIKNAPNTVILIVTDGRDEDSRKTEKDAAVEINLCRMAGWQVIFLGADFDNAAQVAGMGVNKTKACSMSSGNFEEVFSTLGTYSCNYALNDEPILLTDEDRARAIKGSKKAAHQQTATRPSPQPEGQFEVHVSNIGSTNMYINSGWPGLPPGIVELVMTSFGSSTAQASYVDGKVIDHEADALKQLPPPEEIPF